MKPIYWVLIILTLVFVPLTLVIIITRVIIDPPSSWWWTFGVILFYIFIGLITGIIFLIKKLRNKKPLEIKMEIDPDDAEKRAINKLKYYDEFPDNFQGMGRKIIKVGEQGKERTPVLYIWGKGSETKANIDLIVNLKDAKKEINILINKSEDEVLDAIRTIAEYPPEEVKEERILGTDDYGRPMTTIRTKKMTASEKKEEEKEKIAEEGNAF